MSSASWSSDQDVQDPGRCEHDAPEAEAGRPGRADVPPVGERCRLLPWLLVVAIAALTVWSWYSRGLVFDLLRQDWDAAAKIERLRAFFDNCGLWAPVVYVAFVTVEVVVAPIPGLMLYAPGGLIFGPLLGGSLALAGNVSGAGVACALARSLNVGWTRQFLCSERIERIQSALERRGSWLIFLLRLNPLTSSDLVSYAAGLTRIPVWKVMVATGCGMAPLCFAQASLSEGLFQAFPILIYPLLAACGLYVIIVTAILRRLLIARPLTPQLKTLASVRFLKELR